MFKKVRCTTGAYSCSGGRRRVASSILRGIISTLMSSSTYLLADNRLTELGGWHNDELIMSLQEILQEGGDLEGVGWDLDDIENLITDAEKKGLK